VYCGTGGIIPREIRGEPSEEKLAKPGDIIVMAGGRIGKDGIHGATFSSEELHEGSPVTAVQIGDPITQKRMADFILEARDRGLYRCITDNGAGGLSSSVGEMSEFSNGCDLDLEKAPLKYSGLQPWEILISESQERMTFALAPEKLDRFLELAAQMGVEATALGTFTGSGYFHVRYGEKTVVYLSMAFLHNGLPRMQLKAAWAPPDHPEPVLAEPSDYTAALKAMLARLNICSKEMVVRQYDHEVQGGSTVKPLCGLFNDGPSDAAVLRPRLESMQGVVVSHGLCPRYSDIDAYHMMACAIDEALRNYLCAGGSLEGAAGLDNFCWCDPVASDKNPDGAYKLAQLVRANMALYAYTTAYSIPCISGKDSMKNDYSIGEHRISIPPTVLFSIIGRIDDVRHSQTMDVKAAGDSVYILGETRDELGGSEYYALQGFVGTKVPQVHAEEALKLYRALSKALQAGLVRSCHDCSDGGLGTALAESAFAGGLGMEVTLQKVPAPGIQRNDALLFSETQSRFVVTVSPEKREAFERSMKGCVCAEIGRVSPGPRFVVTGLQGRVLIDADIVELKQAWQGTLGNC
ncbi:MAG: AIR synthase-related protein, partial [Pseudomonadota bacterium]